jgi:hypothetical protein
VSRLEVDVPELLARLGIEATRKGREWWCCCPFHEERTASFQIRDCPEDPDKHAMWRCLGACHDGGGAAELVRRRLDLGTIREAIAWMRAGGAARVREPALGAPELVAPARPPARRGSFALPPGVQFRPLEDWPRAAREYAEQRGLQAWQVERWGVGVAVDGRLAGRIVFPWRDDRGIVRGYTARAFLGGIRPHDEPDEKDGAARGFVLGEGRWPAGGRSVVVAVEGMWDGLAVERACGVCFGAARGSHLSPAHASKFATFQEVVACADPDKAGKSYAEALRAALGRWTRFRVVEVPPGFDPAKLERRRGPAALAELLRLPRAAA